MKVYWDGDFQRQGGEAGRAYWAGWKFAYGKTRCFVPFLYRFSQGFVLDILLTADPAELRAYYAKHPPHEAKNDDPANPLTPLPLQKAEITGYACEDGLSYTFFRAVPWEARPETALLRKAYPGILKHRRFFACQRVKISFTDAQMRRKERGLMPLGRKMTELFPQKTMGLTLYLNPTVRFFPLTGEVSAETGGTVPPLRFANPLTGREHTLSIVPEGARTVPKTPSTPELTVLAAKYEVAPALPKGARLQFRSSATLPREAALGHRPVFAPGFGIIGGADGPTVIIATAGGGPDECVSVPAIGKAERYTFRLEGLTVPYRPKAVVTLGKKVRR